MQTRKTLFHVVQENFTCDNRKERHRACRRQPFSVDTILSTPHYENTANVTTLFSCNKISLSIKDPSKGGKIFTLYHPHFTLLFSNRAFTRYLFLRIAFTSLHHPTRDTHTQPFKCNHNTNPMSDCVLCLPHSSANPSVCLLLSTCNLYVYLFLSAGRDHQHHQHGDGRVGAVPSEL